MRLKIFLTLMVVAFFANQGFTNPTYANGISKAPPGVVSNVKTYSDNYVTVYAVYAWEDLSVQPQNSFRGLSHAEIAQVSKVEPKRQRYVVPLKTGAIFSGYKNQDVWFYPKLC